MIGVVGGHARLSVWRAARSSAPTSGRVAGLVGDRVDGAVGLAGRPAEAGEPLVDLVAPGVDVRAGRRCGGVAPTGRAEPVAELEDDPLGAPSGRCRAPW